MSRKIFSIEEVEREFRKRRRSREGRTKSAEIFDRVSREKVSEEEEESGGEIEVGRNFRQRMSRESFGRGGGLGRGERSRKKFCTEEVEGKFRKRRRSREGRKKSEEIFDRGSREKVSEEEEESGGENLS